MISLTTFGEKKLFDVLISRSSMVDNVSGPNSGATYARLPSMPSSSGGSDNAHQNAAWADSANIESSQLLAKVRLVTRQMWWRDGLTGGRWSVMTTPALPTRARLRPEDVGGASVRTRVALTSITAASSTSFASCSFA